MKLLPGQKDGGGGGRESRNENFKSQLSKAP